MGQLCVIFQQCWKNRSNCELLYQEERTAKGNKLIPTFKVKGEEEPTIPHLMNSIGKRKSPDCTATEAEYCSKLSGIKESSIIIVSFLYKCHSNTLLQENIT